MGFNLSSSAPPALPITGIWSIIENFYLKIMFPLHQFIGVDFPPGPHFIPRRYCINLQKCTVLFWVAFLMYYFDDWSIESYVYLALHGSYGICWFIKDQFFPDAIWNSKITFLSFIFSWVMLLGPYNCFPILLMYYKPVVIPLRMSIAIISHSIGIALMIGSDAQKYFTLKYRPNVLITEGFFYRTRNPNFLGEMMIYFSYAFITQQWIGWVIYIYAITLFLFFNMHLKEAYLRQMKGYNAYVKNTGFLLPQIFRSSLKKES